MFSSILPKLEIVEETVIVADTSRTSETTTNSDIRLQIKKKKEKKVTKRFLPIKDLRYRRTGLLNLKNLIFLYITK